MKFHVNKRIIDQEALRFKNLLKRTGPQVLDVYSLSLYHTTEVFLWAKASSPGLTTFQILLVAESRALISKEHGQLRFVVQKSRVF